MKDSCYSCLFFSACKHFPLLFLINPFPFSLINLWEYFKKNKRDDSRVIMISFENLVRLALMSAAGDVWQVKRCTVCSVLSPQRLVHVLVLREGKLQTSLGHSHPSCHRPSKQGFRNMDSGFKICLKRSPWSPFFPLKWA